MQTLRSILILATTTLHLISSQTDAPAQLTEMLQKNPTFQAFLKDNPSIYQLLQSNPELVSQFQLNPNLINQTIEHAKFMNTFLQEHADLNQIIKENPNVYGFILKQVDHAVATGQNSTIVIQMSQADMVEAQKEIQEAQKHLKQNGTSGEAKKETDAFAGLTREQLQALLATYQQLFLGMQMLQLNNYQPTSTVPIHNGLRPSFLGSGPNSALSSNENLSSFNLQPRPSSSIKTSNLNMTHPILNANVPVVTNSGNKSTIRQENLLDLNNLEDIIRLRLLYFAVYNKQPTSMLDLQDFYNVALANLNIRTRKQASDFLDRFKTSNSSQMSISTGNNYASTGYNSFGYNNGVIRRPGLQERISQCKMRKFCRMHRTSPACRTLSY